MRFDPVALLEATANWEPDHLLWLQGIANATRSLDLGGGRVVYTLHFTARGKPPTLVAADDGAPGWPAELVRLNEVFNAQMTALVHVPIGRVRKHGPRIVRENAARTGMTYERYMQLAGPGAAAPPLADFVHAGSGSHRASFVALADRPRTMRPERKRVVEMFVAHFAATARLRQTLGGTFGADEADAVLAPNGQVLHASKKAALDQAPLIDAVLRAERARGPLRRRSPEEAISIWRALVDGRYTIVETVERDGKRLLLARANEPKLRGLTRLSYTEAACAYYTALGHPQKLIGYELGLAPSSAARTTRAAIAKLRLNSAQELVQVIGPLLRDPARA